MTDRLDVVWTALGDGRPGTRDSVQRLSLETCFSDDQAAANLFAPGNQGMRKTTGIAQATH